MIKISFWVHRLKTTDGSLPILNSARKRMMFFGVASFIASLLMVAILIPSAGYSQTLDFAVKNQLANVGGLQCFVLLDSGNAILGDTLTGPLFNICNQPVTTPGGGPSFSTGGGAATPTTIPSIVQQRLREARGEENEVEPGGASADAVAVIGNGLAIFVSGEFESLDREVTAFEDGYESNVWSATVGVDYWFTDWANAGLAIDLSHHDGDFESGGHFNSHSYGVLAFGSFLPTRQFFVQLAARYAHKTYDRDRLATFIQQEPPPSGAITVFAAGQENADFDANQASVSALAGYDVPVGNVTISPRAGVDWYYIDFETYSETGNSGLELTFHDDNETSLQTRVGIRGSASFSLVVPHLSVDWMHEFENDRRDVQVSFVHDLRAKRFIYQTGALDPDWFEINAGVSFVSLNGSRLFANYRTIVGHSFYDSHAGTIGARIAF